MFFINRLGANSIIDMDNIRSFIDNVLGGSSGDIHERDFCTVCHDIIGIFTIY